MKTSRGILDSMFKINKQMRFTETYKVILCIFTLLKILYVS